MSKIALEFESNWVDVLRPLTDRPLDSFVKELAVLDLYRRRLVSSGKAAELLGLERLEFVRYASRKGVSFWDMSEHEMNAEPGRIAALS
ncbi:MAG: hypothetical protein GY759_09755 [Chloroflexi bacterium]|nr:hypothetical protein [Chloroflexota bacterium]